jgi:hypothetical protein
MRQKQIDQENNMLLKKMLNIIKRKSSYNRGNDPHSVGLTMVAVGANNMSGSLHVVGTSERGSEEATAAPLTNKSCDTGKSAAFLHHQHSHPNGHYPNNQDIIAPPLHALSGTLNYFQRKKEFESIQQANLLMVRAIRDTKPSMKRDEWKEHIRQYERLKQ